MPHDTSTLDKPERVPFVVTYNPALRSISSIIRKHFHILTSSPRCYNVFKAAPIVASFFFSQARLPQFDRI